LALNGDVVRVNEFSAVCNWQVVGVQVEQNRCKDRALRKAVTLGSPRTGVIVTVELQLQCRTNRKSYVVYRTAPFSMTSDISRSGHSLIPNISEVASYYGRRIGNRTQAFKWHHLQ